MRSPVEHNLGRQLLKPAFDAGELAMKGIQVATPDGADLHAADDAGKPSADAAGEDVNLAAADFEGLDFDFCRETCGFHSRHYTASELVQWEGGRRFALRWKTKGGIATNGSKGTS